MLFFPLLRNIHSSYFYTIIWWSLYFPGGHDFFWMLHYHSTHSRCDVFVPHVFICSHQSKKVFFTWFIPLVLNLSTTFVPITLIFAHSNSQVLYVHIHVTFIIFLHEYMTIFMPILQFSLEFHVQGDKGCWSNAEANTRWSKFLACHVNMWSHASGHVRACIPLKIAQCLIVCVLDVFLKKSCAVRTYTAAAARAFSAERPLVPFDSCGSQNLILRWGNEPVACIYLVF
jgi:hypothetical protein